MPIPPEFHDPNKPFPTTETVARLQELQRAARARKEQEEKDALNQAIVVQGGDQVVALPEAPAPARADGGARCRRPVVTGRLHGKDAAGNQGEKD